MTNISETLHWDSGRAELQSLGAMLAPIEFVLPDRRTVSPMHVAPWLDEEGIGDHPPLLQYLRGEWPCVPFGAAAAEEHPHGYGSNRHWNLDASDPAMIAASILYPQVAPIIGLTRTVRAVPGQARLELSLGIIARHQTQIPVGLHPVFRLPERAGGMRLCPGQYGEIWTYPGDTGGTSLFKKNKRYQRLENLQGCGGVKIDATRLPFEFQSEDLLLLSHTDGTFSLENLDENYRVTLKWNADHFPSVLLWISNNGRQGAPWNGRHLALGVEPVCSAFDLGTDVSINDNPLSRAGIATSHLLDASQIWTTDYSISVEPLE